jgi:histidyl-tRNA synthetase
VNNRKVLDGVLEAIGLGGEANAGKRLTVMRAIDKFDRLGEQGVRLLLGAGRKDESGDFTKGAGLSDDAINKVVSSTCPVEGKNDQVLSQLSQGAQAGVGSDGVSELRAIADLVQQSGYADRVRVDPSVVRGLEYYTGPVYEVELLLDTKDEKGRPVRFGSVGGGGRYDGLVSRFRGEPVPATGFSIGVSRLLAALQLIGKIDSKPAPGPVVVTVFEQDRIADYQRMVQELRNASIRAELYLGAGKFGAQMKYADKRAAPCVVIQGGDEKEKGEIQIKDLILGARLTTIKDRNEYLKKQAEAQFACKEEKLVDEVRKVLARHNVTWDS